MLKEKNTVDSESRLLKSGPPRENAGPIDRATRAPLRLRLVPGHWVARLPNRIAVACCLDRSQLAAQVQAQGIDPATVTITEVKADDQPDDTVGGVEFGDT